jgi:hypothetical protein
MPFSREEILKSAIENLALGAEDRFSAESSRIQQEANSRGQTRSSGTVELIAQACRAEIEHRVLRLPAEVERVLNGAQINDFDEVERFVLVQFNPLKEALMESAQQALRVLAVRGFGNARSFDSLSSLEKRISPEIHLVLAKLRDSQAIRLSLQPGEVFAGNRALRQIFTGAKSQLDILAST